MAACLRPTPRGSASFTRLNSARFFAFAALVWIAALPAAAADDLFTRKAAARPERLSEAAVWDLAPHAAQPDLARFDNRWLVAFREASSGAANDGAIRIVTSLDGQKWSPLARLEHAIADFSHPRLHALPNGTLLLTAQVVMHADGPSKYRTYGWTSTDARMWEGPLMIGDEGIFIGRLTFSRGKAWAFGHQPGARERTLRGYYADKGMDLEPVIPATLASAQLGNAAIVFLADDSAVAVAEHTGGTLHYATSRPPYRVWQWKDSGVKAGHPQLLRLPDGRLLVTAADGQMRPSLYYLDPAAATLTQTTALSAHPSGESAAPLYHDGSLWTTYATRSPAGATAIYLARIKLP
jgi:hypothetical protein